MAQVQNPMVQCRGGLPSLCIAASGVTMAGCLGTSQLRR
jgi:hypothetical protein